MWTWHNWFFSLSLAPLHQGTKTFKGWHQQSFVTLFNHMFPGGQEGLVTRNIETFSSTSHRLLLALFLFLKNPASSSHSQGFTRIPIREYKREWV